MYGFREFCEDILKHFPAESDGPYAHSFRLGEMVKVHKGSKTGFEKPPTKTDVEKMAKTALTGMNFDTDIFDIDTDIVPCISKGSIVIEFPSGYFFSFAAETEKSRYVCMNIGWRGYEKMTEEKYEKYLRLLDLYFNFPA